MPCVCCRSRGGREGFSSLGDGGRRGLQRSVCGSVLFPSPSGMVAAEIPCSLGRQFAGMQQRNTRWVLGQRSPQASRALGWLCEAEGVNSGAWESKELEGRGAALLCDFVLVLLCRSLLHHCKIMFKNGMRAWFSFGKYFYHYYD